MKYKKIPEKTRKEIANRILVLLFAGADWCANTNKGVESVRSPNNPYYAQAFGFVDCLSELNYGYLGPVNTTEEHNLRFWFETMCDYAKSIVDDIGLKESYRWFVLGMNRDVYDFYMIYFEMSKK